jgi:alpha-tubulin suppressor-like RCC1 family protein
VPFVARLRKPRSRAAPGAAGFLIVAVTVVACGARTDLDIGPPPKPTLLAVVGGFLFSCGLHVGGTVKCWGDNEYGQLGDGTMVDSASPTPVSGLTGVTAITAGSYHACALLSDQTARCWGADYDGQLGDGRVLYPGPPYGSSVPVAVSSLRGVVAISAGGDFTCALLSDRTVACWGKNYTGELGDVTGANSPTPVAVPGVHDAVAISAGYYGGCAALASGQVECWGDDKYGEIGAPACPPSANSSQWCPAPPGLVPGVSGAVGNLSSCAWLANGTAQCWGSNIGGYLGNGGGADTTTWGPDPPGSVSNLTGVTALTLGQLQGCALTAWGSVLCWGENHVGQIGNGSGVDAYTPVAVPGLTDVTALGVGGDHACAVLSGQAIVCWGLDLEGELGQGGASVGVCKNPGYSAAPTVPCATTPVSVSWSP